MPGEVNLQVSPQRWGGTPTGATDKQPDKAYVKTFYPGVTEMAQAARIEDQAGAPAKSMMVMLMPRDADCSPPWDRVGRKQMVSSSC